MSTLTKIALGLMGQLKTWPARGDSAPALALPPPRSTGGVPLMQALQQRQSQREFATTPLPDQVLADILWAAGGVNRPALGGRTAPSAMNSQEVQIYVALPAGLYLYEPLRHALRLKVSRDVRSVTGYQDFTDEAALDLVFVADHSRVTKWVQAEQRVAYAHVTAGAMAQNVYLSCASLGLATVIRAWIDRGALSAAMELSVDQQVLVAQTVGFPEVRPEARSKAFETVQMARHPVERSR
jgi:nitroreductase